MAAVPVVMTLSAPPAGSKAGAVASVATFQKSEDSRYAPAGRAFQRALARKTGKELESVMLKKIVLNEADSEKNAELEALRIQFDITKVKESATFDDYYKLLQMPETATAKEVKKKWSVLSLLCHPDKAPTAHRDKAERRFQAMQKAANTLTDLNSRRAYDSTLPFDEKIPSSKTAPEDFFKKFGACFKRNARFSVKQPVPELGDMDTDFAQVNKFYDFWFGFSSWRDFSHLDKHRASDIAGASSREERRWMKSENDAEKKQAKKNEAARVRKLVDRAEKIDPRMVAEKERVNAAKNAKKAAKAKAEAEAAAAAAKAEADAAAAAAAAADAEARAKKLKGMVKDWRKNFKKAHKYLPVEITAAHLKQVLAEMEPEAFEKVMNTLGDRPHRHPLAEGPNEEQRKAALAAFNEQRIAIVGKEAAEKAIAEEEANSADKKAAIEADFAAWREKNNPEVLAAKKAAAEKAQAEKDAKAKAAAQKKAAKAKQNEANEKEAEKKFAAKEAARKEADAARKAKAAAERKAREEKEAAEAEEKRKVAEAAAARRKAAKAAKKARAKANKAAKKAAEAEGEDNKSDAQLALEASEEEKARKKEEDEKAAYRAERNRRKKEAKKALRAQKEAEAKKHQQKGKDAPRRTSLHQPTSKAQGGGK